jgi:hypothetical protein
MERFMESLGKDRRLAERHLLRVPLQLRLRRLQQREQGVQAESVSRRGVFFTTDIPMDQGTLLDFLLEMPEKISGVRAAQWMCMGHAVRVEPSVAGADAQGVGVEFDFYVVSHTTTLKWESGPGIRGPIRP